MAYQTKQIVFTFNIGDTDAYDDKERQDNVRIDWCLPDGTVNATVFYAGSTEDQNKYWGKPSTNQMIMNLDSLWTSYSFGAYHCIISSGPCPGGDFGSWAADVEAYAVDSVDANIHHDFVTNQHIRFDDNTQNPPPVRVACIGEARHKD